jgi:hypothetical protein
MSDQGRVLIDRTLPTAGSRFRRARSGVGEPPRGVGEPPRDTEERGAFIRSPATAARTATMSKRSRGLVPPPRRTAPSSSLCSYTHERPTPSSAASVAASTRRPLNLSPSPRISSATRRATASTHVASMYRGKRGERGLPLSGSTSVNDRNTHVAASESRAPSVCSPLRGMSSGSAIRRANFQPAARPVLRRCSGTPARATAGQTRCTDTERCLSGV